MAPTSKPKPRRVRYTTSGASLERLGLARTPRRIASQRGWGPFQSLVRERSVEFNLTLDVQNLRQEIEDLLVTRQLLRSRAVAESAVPPVNHRGSEVDSLVPTTAIHSEGVDAEERDAGIDFAQVDLSIRTRDQQPMIPSSDDAEPEVKDNASRAMSLAFILE